MRLAAHNRMKNVRLCDAKMSAFSRESFNIENAWTRSDSQTHEANWWHSLHDSITKTNIQCKCKEKGVFLPALRRCQWAALFASTLNIDMNEMFDSVDIGIRFRRLPKIIVCLSLSLSLSLVYYSQCHWRRCTVIGSWKNVIYVVLMVFFIRIRSKWLIENSNESMAPHFGKDVDRRTRRADNEWLMRVFWNSYRTKINKYKQEKCKMNENSTGLNAKEIIFVATAFHPEAWRIIA